MATMTQVPVSHYDGHRNLTQAQKHDGGPTLAENQRAAYADLVALEAFVAGLKDPKDSCRGASAAALGACTAAGSGVGKTLTQNAFAVETIDGLTPVVGERFLIKNQVAAKDNGIYTITVVGDAVSAQQVLTRATDADTDAEMTTGIGCHVSEGTVNADTYFALTTNDPITLDTTALVFSEIVPIEHAASHVLGGSDEVDGDHLDIDYTPAGYVPSTTPAEASDADHLTAHLAGVSDELVDATHDLGAAAVVQAVQAGQPTTLDVLIVGADTYEIDGVGANINPALAGSAELTLDNVLAEAIANGTESLFWDKLSATVLRIRAADAPQGNIIGSDPSIVLDASGMTNWTFDVGDVNMNTLGGIALGKRNRVTSGVTVSAAMITAGAVRIAFPFTPGTFMVQVLTSAGVMRLTQNDTFEISGDDILVTLTGGGAPDIQNTDILFVTVTD